MSFKEQRGQDSALEISFAFLGLLSRTLQTQLPRSTVNTDGTETASLNTPQLSNVLLTATYEALLESRKKTPVLDNHSAGFYNTRRQKTEMKGEILKTRDIKVSLLASKVTHFKTWGSRGPI